MMLFTVVAAAGAAVMAIASYNRTVEVQPAVAEHRVVAVRQTVSVILAIAEGIWALLDALAYAARPARVSNAPRHRSKWAASLASDDEGD